MKLSDLDHLLEDKRVRFNTEEVNGKTLTIVCYMVGDPQLWKLPLATECRGAVFDSEGTCIARPFHKFFNIGENEHTQVSDVVDKELEVLEKRDGSMIIGVVIDGEVFWKTKKSFYSDVAIEATKCTSANEVALVKMMSAKGMTAIFEFTSPNNKIVMDYGAAPKFTLLAIRDNFSGAYISHTEMEHFSEVYNVDIINIYNLTVHDCLSQSEVLENFEGWCLRDVTTGFYCKQKTHWYLRNHRAKTGLRERDVADMVIDETIDDVKSALALDGFDLTPIEAIEVRVSAQISEIIEGVEHITSFLKDTVDFKQVANTYKNHPWFGMIMSSVRGKEPDYKRHWINNFRDAYTLKCLYNINF